MTPLFLHSALQSWQSEEDYCFTGSLHWRQHIQQSGSGLVPAGQRTWQSAGVGLRARCLVALRDEIFFPPAACVGPGRPNFITRTCDLEVTRLYCSAPGIRPSPGWRHGAVVIAPRQTWNSSGSDFHKDTIFQFIN